MHTVSGSHFVCKNRVFKLNVDKHLASDARVIPGYPSSEFEQMFRTRDNFMDIIVCSINKVDDLSFLGQKYQPSENSGEDSLLLNVSTSTMADILKREFYRKYSNFKSLVLKMTCDTKFEIYIKKIFDPSLSSVDTETQLFVFLNMAFHEKIAMLKKDNSSEDEYILKYALVDDDGNNEMPKRGKTSFFVIWKEKISKK